MKKRSFKNYLISKSNSDLLETLRNRSYYSKSDINAVKKEITKRKLLGKMRKDAGRSKK